MQPELHFQWEWDLSAPPEALWPFISDSNRFNYDRGNTPLKRVNLQRLPNAFSVIKLGNFEYEETPFEWVRPHRWGVARVFHGNPLFTTMRLLFELIPQNGGTRLISHTWIMPTNGFSKFMLPIIMERSFRPMYTKAFREYDRVALLPAPAPIKMELHEVKFVPGGQERLTERLAKLKLQGWDANLVEELGHVIATADEVALARMRPYALADDWDVPRRQALELCLHATRVGVLEFHWEVLCPLCRGVKESVSTLSSLKPTIHCEACNIDSTANFDRSVEITFNPGQDIRPRQVGDFCVGSPQLTPHIVAQQLLQPNETRALRLPLEAGRYRLRALEMAGGQSLMAAEEGARQLTLAPTTDGWRNDEPVVTLMPDLTWQNLTGAQQLFILERLAWSDTAVTAAEVTALQTFRDLFANEALRPGEKISVGSLTLLFTDLRNSTSMYRDAGDAVAFGRVMEHFDILRDAIAAENGGIVKTIGDSVMGVFVRPVYAVRAILQAQRAIARAPQPLQLKAGLHFGPCIAVNLNDRLDYFGSTVNIAARLERFSTLDDIVISDSIYNDLEVRLYLKEMQSELMVEAFTSQIKGFGQDEFELWRIKWK